MYFRDQGIYVYENPSLWRKPPVVISGVWDYLLLVEKWKSPLWRKPPVVIWRFWKLRGVFLFLYPLMCKHTRRSRACPHMKTSANGCQRDKIFQGFPPIIFKTWPIRSRWDSVNVRMRVLTRGSTRLRGIKNFGSRISRNSFTARNAQTSFEQRHDVAWKFPPFRTKSARIML